MTSNETLYPKIQYQNTESSPNERQRNIMIKTSEHIMAGQYKNAID